MRFLTAELNRTILSKGFLTAVAGTALALCIGSYDSFKALFKPDALVAYGTHASALLTALTSDVMLLALPLLSALPATSGFVEDRKSGYLKFALPREGKRRYIAGKAFSAAVSGALALAAGILAAYVLFMLVFMPFEQPAQPGVQPILPEVLGTASLFCLNAALWSLVGLLCSTATMSLHMAYASPFIVFYLLVILVARYFPDAMLLNPQEWLRPIQSWPGGNWGLALFVAELAAVTALGFGAAASRRLKHE